MSFALPGPLEAMDGPVRARDTSPHGWVHGGSRKGKWRSRDSGAAGNGVNFFVGGAIEACGTIVWTIDDVEATLRDWGDRSTP